MAEGNRIGAPVTEEDAVKWMTINPAWARLLGWDGDALIGSNFMELVHPDDRQSTLKVADQVSQIQDMIDKGDKALVIGAIDGPALKDVLAKAAAKKIPVIAYDRLILGSPNVDYYATFDNAKVGLLPAR